MGSQRFWPPETLRDLLGQCAAQDVAGQPDLMCRGQDRVISFRSSTGLHLKCRGPGLCSASGAAWETLRRPSEEMMTRMREGLRAGLAGFLLV